MIKNKISTKITGIAIVTILTLSIMLAAIPTASATEPTINISTLSFEVGPTGGEAKWSNLESKIGSYSVYLDDGEVEYTDDDDYGVARVVFPVSIEFSDITDLSYWFKYYATDGSPAAGPGVWMEPYMILYLDTTGDGEKDCSIVLDYIKPSPLGYTPAYDTWIQWDLNEYNVWFAWDGTEMTRGTLAELQAELQGTVIAVKVAVGETEFVGTQAYIDDIIIDGVTYPLEPNYGPVETETTIVGYGATPGGLVEVYWKEVPAGYLAEDSASAISPYTYSIDITIPDAVAGDHGIVVKDMESNAWATTTYTVTPKIVLDPAAGIIGDPIAVSGTGFGATETIEISYSGIPLVTTSAPVKTGPLGSFDASFKIPTAMTDVSYEITATGKTTDESATDTLTVGKYIRLTPDRGMAGAEISIVGRGFADDSTVDVYFGSESYAGGYQLKVLSDVPTDEDGYFSDEFTVPEITVTEPTPYVVTAIEETGRAEADFTVTPSTSITLQLTSGKKGDTIGISGLFFTPKSKITLHLDTTILATIPTTITTYENGAFGAAWSVKFTVPDVATGSYTVKATDEEGVYATATFNVIVPIIVIQTRATEYQPGDTVSIYGNCTTAQSAFLEITDSDGLVFWTTTLGGDDWESMSQGAYFLLKWTDNTQVTVLPTDAPLGSWNFTAYDSIAKTKILDTNLFTVGEAPGPQPELPAEITEQDTLDSMGAPKTSFMLGETVLVSATVTNVGVTSQFMRILVQLKDPQATVLAPTFMSTTLAPGQSFEYAPGFIMPLTGYTAGEWTAKIMILDNWAAQGGLAIATAITVTFTVTS